MIVQRQLLQKGRIFKRSTDNLQNDGLIRVQIHLRKVTKKTEPTFFFSRRQDGQDVKIETFIPVFTLNLASLVKSNQ